jgi:arsenate reductase (thioredoxin)
MDHKPRVLFFSTSDSTRSQMAEGFLRKLAGEELAVVSTAVQSSDSDPLAAEVMKEIGVDISGQQSRGVKESLKEHFSYVITVSDDSRERSPVWPFTRNLFHWNIADPESVNGSSEQKREAFRRVRDEISWKVREFLARLHGSQRSPNRATV